MTIAHNTPAVTIWAYEAPAKHTHRVSGWSFVDNEVNDETVLQCSRCPATWHTGIPADDDYHEIDDLKEAAANWLRDELLGKVTRRQLPLPLAIPEAITWTSPKRRYTVPHPVDTSAQLSLFAMAA